MEQEIIECPCGSIIKKGQLSRHTRTRKHINHLEKVKKKRSTLDLTKSDLHNNIKDDIEDYINETQENYKNDVEAEAEAETEADDSENSDNDTEADNQEVEELVVEAKEKKGYNKEHLDKIRQKAHEVLKAKKMARIQAKLDKENELITKAKMYDELIRKQKEEEERRKREELEKIEREKEKRLRDYDKLLEENMRLKQKNESKNVIQEYAKQQIIDDLKNQRLQYLSKHLGINSFIVPTNQ